jgi:hypothetical protein
LVAVKVRGAGNRTLEESDNGGLVYDEPKRKSNSDQEFTNETAEHMRFFMRYSPSLIGPGKGPGCHWHDQHHSN